MSFFYAVFNLRNLLYIINASSYAHYQIVSAGDFAMNHMDLLTGWIDISKYEGVTSPDYRVFTLNDKEMSAEYFLKVFQYYYANKVFFGFGQGVATLGRWRLPAINFKKIDVPVPPVSEQRRIVAAIDDSVGKVDALSCLLLPAFSIPCFAPLWVFSLSTSWGTV